MSESRAVAYPRQRRIRHIKSLAGRNIAATQEDESFLSTDNGEVDIVSTFVVASRSSSAVTSRASSPSAHWDNTPSRSKSTALHRRTGSVEPPPHLLPATTMRRSESSSSISSTTVEDSSMTKSAYKKKQRRPESMISTTACPVINNSNNTYGKGLLDCYYTLHLSADEMPFYRSEIIPNTIDPTFRVLDTSQWSSWYDGVQTEVVVRLWARHSFPESATQTGEKHHDATNKVADDQDFELVIEWHVDLNALSWIGKVLQDIPGAFPENTLLFELDDGFYTAPNIVSKLLAQSKRSSLAEPYSDMDQASVNTENSINKIKRSYTYDHLLKINTLKACVFDTQQSAKEVQQNMNDLLINEADRFRLVRERNSRQYKLEGIEGQIVKKNTEIRRDRRRIAELRETLERRKSKLNEATERLRLGQQDLQDSEEVLERSVQTHQRLFHKLNRRKKELIADLFSIYPIEQSLHDVHQFCIRGVYLPNSVYTGCNDESIATALGFTAHLVSMLAFYLSIPLRYPITPMSSRATIKDPVSSINGPTTFPLYAKGVDRYRFEFGVFLLNKNIEQLMNAYGLIVMDLRHTLPNIHYFIQAILTTSESSGPTSVSVLSISNFANQQHPTSRPSSCTPPATDMDDERKSSESLTNGSPPPKSSFENDQLPKHLTLQPIISPATPSPSTSTASVTYSKFSSSPKHHHHLGSPVALVSASQAMAAPPTLDTVTTTSKWNSNDKK
ncbi:uv radiation resistance protein [Lichtheimia corymbifera JMRC:FSU:9682]|uniref:Autophagy-related protein 14 n=1 Tax=Lichtheimia corymbifera JMRC:FSU:9682 TaxID=1263082 RepID=A0A068S572_9FUNG|nr:uv radiation resistance protein [Lichtheimia corymbifera JMRC:FSU:9682]